MSIVDVYVFDTGILQEDFKFLIDPQISSQSSTQFILSDVGILKDNVTFIGNFTLSSGNITGGTITEVQVNGIYGFEADITGLSIPVTSSGFGFSFNVGAVFAPGSTYYAKAPGSGLAGEGNDTYYADFQTTITPGGGVNTIYANAAGIQINLKGSLTSDTVSAATGGLVILDVSSSGTAYDYVTGSAKLLFEGSDVFVQDNNGVVTLPATATQAIGEAANDTSWLFSISDSAAAVSANLNALQDLYAAGQIASLILTDAGTPTITVTATQLAADSGVLQDISGAYDLAETGMSVQAALTTTAGNIVSMSISDSAANVFGSLAALQSLETAGKLGAISLTDTTNPTITITAAQDAADAGVLAEITGKFALDITAGSSAATIKGVAGVANTVVFTGNAASYTETSFNDGSDLVVTNTASGTVYHVSGVQALQFADSSVIVAASPGPANAVTTGNLAELYGAVFGREPDVSGLAYYQAYMAGNPSTSLQTYAEFFLNSTEYTGNPAHNYAQTAAGDEQFISDSYQNLLHRTASASEVAFYETNVIAPALKGLQAGTAAYAAADLAAHALTLVYFSNSSEFLGNVNVTGSNPVSPSHWLVLV